MQQSRSTQQSRVGMVVWHGLPAALPRAGDSIGGLETGAWTLARGLSQFTNVKPVFVVRSTRWSVPAEVDSVSLVAYREILANIRNRFADCVDLGPPLRIKQFSASLLWQFPVLAIGKFWKRPRVLPMLPDPRLSGIHVDVFAGFGVNGDSARVVATAKQLRIPSILFLESNADLDPRLATSEKFVNAYGETADEQRFALKNATAIVCQSSVQLRMLEDIFGRGGVLLRNPIEKSAWKINENVERQHVLWIGRYDEFHKRPRMAMEIARRLPSYKFRMIVNRQDADVERLVRSEKPNNVELVDYVPFDRMPLEFAKAKAFLCTGNPEHEGFPNVLLQSAAAHTPICSLHDFDNFLSSSGAGVSCKGDIEIAAKSLSTILRGEMRDWRNVDLYLDRYHSLEAISKSTAELILDQIEQFNDSRRAGQ